MYKLILFDADDTLINPATGALHPGVAAYFQARPTGESGPAMAIISNQGGPACRNAGWSWSARFPTLAEIEATYNDLAHTLRLPLYLALVYLDRQGGRHLPEGLTCADPRVNSSWRLPGVGMIAQAMQDFGVEYCREVLVVSTRPEARRAARTAGVALADGATYFNQRPAAVRPKQARRSVDNRPAPVPF